MNIITSEMARKGWKKVRRAAQASNAAGFAKHSSTYNSVFIDPDFSQVSVMWAEYEVPAELGTNLLSKVRVNRR